MTTDTIPPAEETIELEIPSDLYVGQNVVRRHVVEFFYRASSHGLLATGETVLAVFDCILLEPDGRRLGGLTLHDYVVLTDQNLITWGRGLNRDVIDKFEWANVALDKYGRRTPLEGVVKISYRTKVAGNKRRISIKSANGGGSEPDEVVADPTVPGVILYFDLMPLGDVRVCAGMIRFLIKGAEDSAAITNFKEHFRADISRSQRRMAQVNSVLRPFYMDLGNGMLVEADTIQSLRSVRSSPYRGPASPYRLAGVKANRGSASAAALNRGSRGGDTGAPSGKDSGSGLRETVRLNPGPVDRPSKLEEYENRAAGRPTRSSSTGGSSRLTTAGDATPSASPGAVMDEGVRSSRPAPRAAVPRPAPAPRATIARPAPAARVPAVRPAPAPRPRPATNGDVLDETNAGSYEVDRPVTMPVAVALPRALLNPYSLSRFARGLWFDPRNFGRNLGDLTQTTGAMVDMVDVVTNDEEARTLAVRRVRSSAYSVFRDNPILHYTVWPFVKPILDVILSGDDLDRVGMRRNRLQVRGEVDEDVAGLDDLGAMTASEIAAARPAKVAIAPDAPIPAAEPPRPTPAPVVPPVQAAPPKPAPVAPPTESEAPLNVSGKGPVDPTAGTAKDVPPAPPSKLGDDDEGSKKIGFKK